MRWLSIDHGTKKMGLAVCDEQEILASPLMVLPVAGDDAMAAIVKLAREEGVQALLVGLPQHKDGAVSSTAALAVAFGRSLAEKTRLPLRFLNEHLTTAEANRLLAERGVKPKDRKAKLDAAAAAVILEEWLNLRRAHHVPPNTLGDFQAVLPPSVTQ